MTTSVRQPAISLDPTACGSSQSNVRTNGRPITSWLRRDCIAVRNTLLTQQSREMISDNVKNAPTVFVAWRYEDRGGLKLDGLAHRRLF